jgi:UDP-N-acetylglucosamine--N-acetylmuramyl-(pentapeptide) pyrophosphoryl-undecaprenol N-acetylglucosamine transferase
MRILISGGGTGGHVYPALAVAAALPQNSTVLYVTSAGGMENDLLRRVGTEIPTATIRAAALRGRAPWTMLRNMALLAQGAAQARRLMGDFRPEAVLVTGGYVSVPVGIAARQKRIPLVVFLPDVVPGLAVRFLARLATRVATTTPDSARYLPRGKVVVTGYPVRPALVSPDRQQARASLGLAPEERVLLVYGGSRGARSINRAIGAGLAALLELSTVIHVCGQEGDDVELRQQAAQLPEKVRARYRLYSYLHDEMPAALAAADVAVCRSGASTLGELPAAGLPAILVPYPYVHQEENADYLVRNGAAVKVLDSQLRGAGGRPDPTALLAALRPILEDAARRAGMAAAARRIARPDAAGAIVEVLRTRGA